MSEKLEPCAVTQADQENARAALVAELRKIGFDTHADNVAAGHGVLIPSYVTLDLIAAARTPANGEQVARVARAMCDRVNGQGDYDDNPERHAGWNAQARAAIAAMDSTPTQDARERVKVLEEALTEAGRMQFAAANIPEGYIDGWADCVEHIRNTEVRAALVEARHEADTALGNQEERL